MVKFKDEIQKLVLKRINVKFDDLLLDPNNPRFSKLPKQRTPESECADPEVQEEAFRRMQAKRFDIKELMDSIKGRGYAPVDNLFVKKVKGKYLVKEGNRRLTAIKRLLQLYEGGKKKDVIHPEILKTLLKIECMDLTENSDDEVNFVLGLRHHGSIKLWDLLPSAYDIYAQYMGGLGASEPEDFVYDLGAAKKVAALYSIRLTEVRDKLKAYRVYLQLLETREGVEIGDDKFSMIYETIADRKARPWFDFKEPECVLSDEGADTFLDLIVGNSKQPPVITATNSGSSSLRDFRSIIKNGDATDIDRVVEAREQTSLVWADVKAKMSDRGLLRSLELASATLGKIRLKEDFGGLSSAEKEVLDEIKEIIDKLDKLTA